MSRSKYRPKMPFHGRGPRWFRSIFSLRVIRREARAALHRPGDLEAVILTPYNRVRPYWL